MQHVEADERKGDQRGPAAPYRKHRATVQPEEHTAVARRMLAFKKMYPYRADHVSEAEEQPPFRIFDSVNGLTETRRHPEHAKHQRSGRRFPFHPSRER